MKEEIITATQKELIPVIKLFPSSYSTKEISTINPNAIYSVNTLNRKNTFKISEKECSDINSLVRNSVEKINDILNFQAFDSSKKNNEKIKTEKENTMKTNFTFNINNFINVPNSPPPHPGLAPNHKNGTLNFVNKKKLFEEGINMQQLNNNENKSMNKNINIINFTNSQIQKNKKIENEKDKSITVNMRYKKYNINDDFINKNPTQNKNNLNTSIKNKNKESQINNNINNNILKYSISDDIQNKQNKKFTPNLININSLSAHKNIKNFIFKNNNNNINKNNKSHVNNNNNNYAKEKPKKQSGNKKFNYKSPTNNNKSSKSIKNSNFHQEDCKALLFTEEKNSVSKIKSNVNIFSKSLSNKNKEKLNLIHNMNFDDKNIYNDIQDFSRTTSNKPIKKENTFIPMRQKSGYSCEHRNNNNFHSNNQNMHKILNKIYYKEFPNKIKTNTIMKLILFMNEYLISNNLLDDYYDISNQEKLENLSNFISDKIFVDYPQQDDVNFDQMINSIKKIQRAWRKNRMEKYLEKNNKNEENELKKMVLNKYIKKSGFKIKKIIGLFNSMVECFDLIENEKEIEEMFYNIQQVIKRKLSPYEKNLLYKEYINNIIYEN